jgi:hypothetical protein
MSSPTTPRSVLNRIANFTGTPTSSPFPLFAERSASPSSSSPSLDSSVWLHGLPLGPIDLRPLASSPPPSPVLSPGPPTPLAERAPSQITTEDEEPLSPFMPHDDSPSPCSSETIFGDARMSSRSASPSAAPSAHGTAQDSLNEFPAPPPRTPSESSSDSAVSEAQVLQSRGKGMVPGPRGNTDAPLFVYLDREAARSFIARRCKYFSSLHASRKLFS